MAAVGALRRPGAQPAMLSHSAADITRAPSGRPDAAARSLISTMGIVFRQQVAATGLPSPCPLSGVAADETAYSS